MPVFDAMGPDWVARLYTILDRHEPKILGMIQRGDRLAAVQLERIGTALINESICLMTPEGRMTEESEQMRWLFSAVNRIAPYNDHDLPNYGIPWDRTKPIDHSDPYGDGGAAAGWGPRPGTSSLIPPEEMPAVLHPVPDDYDIPEDPSVAILGPRRPDEPPLRRYAREGTDDTPAEGSTP